jgi:hypothetical protein
VILTQSMFISQAKLVYLILDASLSSPPSELSSFRDVTLYAKIFDYEDVLLLAEKETRSYYWSWMIRNGIRDYVSDMITPQEGKNLKAIRISEDDSLPWSELSFYNNGLSVKALHQFSLIMILEYLRLVRGD